MQVVKTYKEALQNAKRFQKVLTETKSIASKGFSSFYHWYYFPEINALAPSKFIGYKNTSTLNYQGEGNGGITQNALEEYFDKLDKGSAIFKRRYREIETSAKALSKKVNSRVLNGSGGIYIPKKQKTLVTNAELINFPRWVESMKSSFDTFEADKSLGPSKNLYSCFVPQLFILTSITRSNTGFTGITKKIYDRLKKSKVKWCYIVFHESEKRAYLLLKSEVNDAIEGGSWRLGQNEDQYKINIKNFWLTKYRNFESNKELVKSIRKYYSSKAPKNKKSTPASRRKKRQKTIQEQKEAFLKSLSKLDSTRSKRKIEVAIRKNRSFIEKLKQHYNYNCQFPNCNAKIKMKGGKWYVEVSHIKPYHKGGEDSIGNLLVLCPNHHKEFDLGILNISKQSEKLVSGKLNGKEFIIKFSV